MFFKRLVGVGAFMSLVDASMLFEVHKHPNQEALALKHNDGRYLYVTTGPRTSFPTLPTEAKRPGQNFDNYNSHPESQSWPLTQDVSDLLVPPPPTKKEETHPCASMSRKEPPEKSTGPGAPAR